MSRRLQLTNLTLLGMLLVGCGSQSGAIVVNNVVMTTEQVAEGRNL